MKNIIYILLALATLSACSDKSEESGDIHPETTGLMSITVTGTDSSDEKDDKIETVRFLVFKNASTSPQLELNKRLDVPSAGPGEEVTRFETILEVSRKTTTNDKMVVVIANEPATMETALNAVDSYNALANMPLELGDFLIPDHTALGNGKVMPMTGVARTGKVYTTEAEAAADPARMTIHRVTARIDVLIKKSPDLILNWLPEPG